MKAKKRKARTFWVVINKDTGEPCIARKTRKQASECLFPQEEIIKVTEQLAKKRGK